jgi:hypothetical protein
MCAAIHHQIQYLAEKTNELFERRMREAAQRICERQNLFHGRAA